MAVSSESQRLLAEKLNEAYARDQITEADQILAADEVGINLGGA
jgi:hypothetical protein